MLSLKNSLAVLRKTNALLEGHFILSSGLHSPSYVQCAKLLSNPSKASKICLSLSKKIKKKIKKIDLILSPAMGGIIIGYEIGKLLKKETIFCERVSGKFVLRRGFNIKKNSRVLIVACIITCDCLFCYFIYSWTNCCFSMSRSFITWCNYYWTVCSN